MKTKATKRSEALTRRLSDYHGYKATISRLSGKLATLKAEGTNASEIANTENKLARFERKQGSAFRDCANLATKLGVNVAPNIEDSTVVFNG